VDAGTGGDIANPQQVAFAFESFQDFTGSQNRVHIRHSACLTQ
jgi:hypothetical protein